MGSGQMTYEWKCAGLDPWAPGSKRRHCTPTDAALDLGIAHVWLSERAGGEEPIEVGTDGFERFRDYVLGYQDGTPKGPRWAAPLSGVPSYTIKALARHSNGRPESFSMEAFGSEEDLTELISKAELLHPELSPRTTARYTEVPSTFIGGTVYDYEADEVIEGALVTLKPSDVTSDTGGTRDDELTVATDEFGNFLVDAPERGAYHVVIEKEGYLTKELGPIEVGHEPNLRDFAMFLDSKGLIW